MNKALSFIPLSLQFIIHLTIISNAQLYNAHVGLETFKSYGMLQYDQQMEITRIVNVSDNQLFDLNSRKSIITSDNYKVGFDGN